MLILIAAVFGGIIEIRTNDLRRRFYERVHSDNSDGITIVLNGSGAAGVTKGVSSELFTEIEHKKSGKAYVFGDGKADIRLVSTSGDMYIK